MQTQTQLVFITAKSVTKQAMLDNSVPKKHQLWHKKLKQVMLGGSMTKIPTGNPKS